MFVGGYFVLFWSATGQTPGMRLMRLQVIDRTTARRVHFFRALIRLGGLVLAIIPLFAGFLPVLFDGRRRALQDYPRADRGHPRAGRAGRVRLGGLGCQGRRPCRTRQTPHENQAKASTLSARASIRPEGCRRRGMRTPSPRSG